MINTVVFYVGAKRNIFIKFCPYLNVGCRGILKPKKENLVQRELLKNSSIDKPHHTRFMCAMKLFFGLVS